MTGVVTRSMPQGKQQIKEPEWMPLLLEQFDEKLQALSASVNERFSSLEEDISKLNSQVSSLVGLPSKVKDLENDVSHVKSELSLALESATRAEERAEKALIEVNKNAQYSRRNMLLFYGITNSVDGDEEDCITKTKVFISTLLEVPISPGEITIAHRLGSVRKQKDNESAKSKSLPVVAVFSTLAKKRAVFDAKKKLKGKTNSDGMRYGVTLFLTKENKAILDEARRFSENREQWRVYATETGVKLRIMNNEPIHLNTCKDIPGYSK